MADSKEEAAKKAAEEKVIAEKKATEEKEAAEKKAAEEAANKDHTVSLQKHKLMKEKFDAATAELEQIKKDKAAEQEKTLLEQSEFKQLADQKGKRVAELETEIAQIKQDFRNITLNTFIKEEIVKHGPRDVNVILPLINLKDLEVIEEDGKVTSIKGLPELLEKLKKEKDYLFGGEPVKGDKKDDKENGKAGANSVDSVEAEFKTLLEKSDLSFADQARLKVLATEVKRLRAESNKT